MHSNFSMSNYIAWNTNVDLYDHYLRRNETPDDSFDQRFRRIIGVCLYRSFLEQQLGTYTRIDRTLFTAFQCARTPMAILRIVHLGRTITSHSRQIVFASILHRAQPPFLQDLLNTEDKQCSHLAEFQSNMKRTTSTLFPLL